MKWKGLILSVLVFSCEKKIDEEYGCGGEPLMDMAAPVVVGYQEVEAGKSCEEFNQRQYSDYSTYSCAGFFDAQTVPVNDAEGFSSQSPVYTNDTIAGIESGDTIGFSEKFLFEVDNNLIVKRNKNSFNHLDEVRIDKVIQKILLYQNHLIIIGHGFYEIRDFEFKLLSEFSGVGFLTVAKRDKELFLLEREYLAELSDENYCNEIKYLDNSKHQMLSSLYKIDLETLERSLEGVYYGDLQLHVDVKDTLLITKNYWQGSSQNITGLLKMGHEERLRWIPGMIPNQSYLKQYGEDFHVFHNDNLESYYSVLDKNFEYVGGVDRLGQGDFMGAARFTENFSYLMTFFMDDPLYVIDHSEKRAPVLRGDLSFPGIPYYLDTIGEQKLFSVNFEADDMNLKLFDASNPDDPRVLDSLSIGQFEYAYTQMKNILKYQSYVLLKGEKWVRLFKVNDDRIEEVQTWMNDGHRYFFQGNFLYRLSQNGREKIKLDG